MKFTIQKFLITAIGILFLTISSFAQRNPVKWEGTATKINDSEYVINIAASIESGWYVYSQKLESDMGPVPTSLDFSSNTDIKVDGEASEDGNRKEGMDKAFGMNVVKYLDNVTFSQKVVVPSGTESVECVVTFMTCNGEMCLPPKDVPITISL